MDKNFRLNIVSLEKTIYEGFICSLIVPAELGYLGVLANHAPLVTMLTPGKITLREKPDSQKVFHCKAGGFLEVLKNTATVLVDSISEA
ncbi:MAG: ATP synthase F1 subunit epsilon [Candidatus Omnitrophota bacterium]|nr:ATP synthase F1 subunit epsilon [Candidatus Omnitrophota bacterium]